MGGGGMKPYYDEDGITIYHGDCRDIAPTPEKDPDLLYAEEYANAEVETHE